jgi:PKD repeat protein
MIKTTQYFVVVLLMLVFANTKSFAQYNGGSADGAHTDVLMQTSCANPPQFYAYFGGIADGAHTDLLNNTTCASPPQFFAYMGGSSDGAHTDMLNNTTCADPPQFFAYYGGTGDGFSASAKVVNCTTLTPVADFSVSSTTICVGQTVTYTDLSANGPSNWNWTFASGTPSVSSVQNPTVTYNTAGTFDATLTATNYNGNNTIVKTSYIVVNALPTLTVSSGSICNGQSYTITPTGAITYTYSGGSAVVSPTTTTSYTVTGTDANGCTNTNLAVSIVTVNSIPVISVTSGAICSGNSFTMNATGANTYTYSSGSSIVSPTVNSTYTVTGKSLAGCISAMGAVSNVTVNTTPTITVNGGTICSGNSFTINPSGANSYVYSSGSSIVSPTISNTYTVTGTSIEGCISAPVLSSLTVNTTPTVTVNSGSICAGQSFTMLPTGANSYTYSSGASVVTPIGNTTYTVTGASAIGCISTPVTSSVVVNAMPSITTSATPTLICSGETATLTVSGANSYSWSTSSTSTVIVISPTVTVNYTVTGTNSFGCKTTAIITESVSPCIGLEEITGTKSTITIYPNPASSLIHVELDVLNYYNTTVQITNSLGQIMYTQKIEVSETTINTSNLSTGIYFVTIIEGNQTTTKKIIIQ